MTTFHPAAAAHRLHPAAGLAAAVVLAIGLFTSGLAAMDRLTAPSMSGLRSGTFSAEGQGDYNASAPKRLAPQRAAIRPAG